MFGRGGPFRREARPIRLESGFLLHLGLGGRGLLLGGAGFPGVLEQVAAAQLLAGGLLRLRGFGAPFARSCGLGLLLAVLGLGPRGGLGELLGLGRGFDGLPGFLDRLLGGGLAQLQGLAGHGVGHAGIPPG